MRLKLVEVQLVDAIGGCVEIVAGVVLARERDARHPGRHRGLHAPNVVLDRDDLAGVLTEPLQRVPVGRGIRL